MQNPPLAESPVLPWTPPIRPGTMTLRDLDRYDVRYPAPTRSDYRGYDVYGMATPSSGGTAVGEALNILEQFDLSEMTVTEALHHYLEASALSYADRNRYVGDDTSRRLLRELLERPLRGRAGLPDQPGGGVRQAGRAGQPRRTVRGLRRPPPPAPRATRGRAPPT